MDKFQIVELTEQFKHAGTKATADITEIGERLGFKKLTLKMRNTKDGYIAKMLRQAGYFKDWINCYKSITQGAVILLQHPFHYPQLTRDKTLYNLKLNKKVKFISVVHDVEKLRAFRFNGYYKKEFETMLDIADVIIVHNEVMKKYFIECGVSVEKLVNLQIFDYIQQNDEKKVSFEKAITIAGNLDTIKCQYISQLGELKTIKINLYGSNYDKSMEQYKNVKYHGAFPVNEIPHKLTSGFGLVWDGESIEECKGLSGQYLRYNNPHKLSLYISSGLPVVIWKEAAEANFVTKHKLGICVSNLKELDNIFDDMTESKYNELINNVMCIRKKLVNGEYAEAAISSAVEKILH